MTYKCEYCESEYEGRNCPNCGAPHPATPITNRYTANPATFNLTTPKNKKSVTEQTWFVIFMLLFFFPAGLLFMWKNKAFSSLTRIIITLFFALLIYRMIKVDEMIGTNTVKPDNEKAVEMAVTNTPTPSPAPTKKPLSNKDKFVEDVTDMSGVNKQTAGNLYDLFHKKMGFDEAYITRKSDTGKANYDFIADGFNVMVAFKKDGVSSIKSGFYTLYDGKEIKIDKQGILDRQLIDKAKYYFYTQEIILDNVKTPKTTVFPNSLSYDLKMQRNGDLVAVQGYFDAQNTYGALVRSKYLIEISVTDLDENIYEPVYINIDGEITGKWVDLD